MSDDFSGNVVDFRIYIKKNIDLFHLFFYIGNFIVHRGFCYLKVHNISLCAKCYWVYGYCGIVFN